jgi:hypothetical protein
MKLLLIWRTSFFFFFFGSNLEDLNGINDGSNQLPPSQSATSFERQEMEGTNG